MTKFNRFKIKFLSTLTLLGILLSGTSSAFATPNANQQGGSNGVIFFTEQTDGAIYLGDISNSPATRTVFWQDPTSRVDSVAVTGTRIAWSSMNAVSGGILYSKVFITDVGLTAGTIATVTIPGNVSVKSLAADYFAERFYVTTSNGNIYSFSSDGTDLYLAVDGTAVGTTISNAIKDVIWGLSIDPYNSQLYFCNWTSGNLWKAAINGATVSTPTILKAAALTSCDGVGVDPVTQQVFLAAVNPASVKSVSQSGTVTSITPSSPLLGTAPSSMFVSHATQKIYFATELNVYEIGYDGSGLRALYTGTRDPLGFENLAVYYGATQSNLVQVVTAASANVNRVMAPTPSPSPSPSSSSSPSTNPSVSSTPSASTTSSSTPQATMTSLARTGNEEGLTLVTAGLLLALVALGLWSIATSRRMRKNQ